MGDEESALFSRAVWAGRSRSRSKALEWRAVCRARVESYSRSTCRAGSENRRREHGHGDMLEAVIGEWSSRGRSVGGKPRVRTGSEWRCRKVARRSGAHARTKSGEPFPEPGCNKPGTCKRSKPSRW